MNKYIKYIVLLILTSVVPSKASDSIVFNKELNDKNLVQCMEYYGIDNTKWVLAQAKLETGNYTSKLCKQGNNLFGLYNSRKKRYFKFKHWSLSVKAYKDFIQREGRYNKEKYDETNYHLYLKKIKYAEDPTYINKLREIIKRNENGNKRTVKRPNKENQKHGKQLNSRVPHRRKSNLHSRRKHKQTYSPKKRRTHKKNTNGTVPKQHGRTRDKNTHR